MVRPQPLERRLLRPQLLESRQPSHIYQRLSLVGSHRGLRLLGTYYFGTQHGLRNFRANIGLCLLGSYDLGTRGHCFFELRFGQEFVGFERTRGSILVVERQKLYGLRFGSIVGFERQDFIVVG